MVIRFLIKTNSEALIFGVVLFNDNNKISFCTWQLGKPMV